MVTVNRKFLLISFLAFMLLGIQAIQASTIHDHAQHQVDCVLCHFDSYDPAAITQVAEKQFEPQKVYLINFSTENLFFSYYTSYQGRSPPGFYS